MEYIIILILLLVAIATILFIFEFNIKKIKEISKNDKMLEISNKFPDNKEICKYILKKLNNEKVNIKENTDGKDKTSLYVAITDTIFIANIKDIYTRIQTVAHECIHSIQSRNMLLFNFIFTNVYAIYFFAITIFSLFGKIQNYQLQIIMLLIMAFIQYVVRSYLETDAMTRAEYLSKEYMEEYNKENEVCSEKEIEEITKKYAKINKMGIPAYNTILFVKAISKPCIYTIFVLCLNLIRYNINIVR